MMMILNLNTKNSSETEFSVVLNIGEHAGRQILIVQI